MKPNYPASLSWLGVYIIQTAPSVCVFLLFSAHSGPYPDFVELLFSWYTDPAWQNLLIFPWMDEEALLLSEAYTDLEIETLIGRGHQKKTMPLSQYTDLFKIQEVEGTRILVKGDPGTGKTTFTHKLAFDWATGRLDYYDAVFVLKLKFAEAQQPIESMIKEQLAPIGEIDVSETMIGEYLKSGRDRVLLVLDGLDEINLKKYSKVQEVLQGKVYRKCSILTTTRPFVVHEIQNKMSTIARIKGFSQEKAKQFVSNILDEEESKKFFWELDQKRISSMCNVPLVIQALALLFKENQEFPATFTATYDELVFFMRKTCEAAKDLTDEEIEKSMEEVAELAYKGLTRDDKQLIFSRNEIKNENIYKLGILTAERSGSGFKPTTVLQFLHKTFQENSAADHIGSRLQEKDRVPWETLLKQIQRDLKSRDYSSSAIMKTLSDVSNENDDVTPFLERMNAALKGMAMTTSLYYHCEQNLSDQIRILPRDRDTPLPAIDTAELEAALQNPSALLSKVFSMSAESLIPNMGATNQSPSPVDFTSLPMKPSELMKKLNPPPPQLDLGAFKPPKPFPVMDLSAFQAKPAGELSTQDSIPEKTSTNDNQDATPDKRNPDLSASPDSGESGCATEQETDLPGNPDLDESSCAAECAEELKTDLPENPDPDHSDHVSSAKAAQNPRNQHKWTDVLPVQSSTSESADTEQLSRNMSKFAKVSDQMEGFFEHQKQMLTFTRAILDKDTAQKFQTLQDYSCLLEGIQSHRTLLSFIVGKLPESLARELLLEIAELVVRHSVGEEPGTVVPFMEVKKILLGLAREKWPEEETGPEVFSPVLLCLDETVESARTHACGNLNRCCSLEVTGFGNTSQEFANHVLETLCKMTNVLLYNMSYFSLQKLASDWSENITREIATALYQSPLVSLQVKDIDSRLTRHLLENLPASLRRLSLNQCDVTARLPPSVSLTHLYLENCTVDLDAMLETSFPNLTICIFKNLPCTQKDITALKGALRSGRIPQLEELAFECAKLTGCQDDLAAILKYPSLRIVDLNSNALTLQDGQSILRSIQEGKLDHLARLNLHGNPDLGPIDTALATACEERDIAPQIDTLAAKKMLMVSLNSQMDFGASLPD